MPESGCGRKRLRCIRARRKRLEHKADPLGLYVSIKGPETRACVGKCPGSQRAAIVERSHRQSMAEVHHPWPRAGRVYVDRARSWPACFGPVSGDAGEPVEASSVRAVPCRQPAHELQRRKIRCPPRSPVRCCACCSSANTSKCHVTVPRCRVLRHRASKVILLVALGVICGDLVPQRRAVERLHHRAAPGNSLSELRPPPTTGPCPEGGQGTSSCHHASPCPASGESTPLVLVRRPASGDCGSARHRNSHLDPGAAAAWG